MVPVYNVELYVAECIESVLNQTYQNFELILVDDGSPDKSGEICDEYAKKDTRIRVFHKENGGLIHTRRFAIDKAEGDWYVFLDSDDTLQPNALETIYNKILQYHCDLVIYGWQRFCGDTVLEDTATGRSDFIFPDKRSLYKTVFFDQQYNSLCRKAVKANLFDGRDYSFFYSIKHAEDLLQSIEILENAEQVLYTDEILYNYRNNPTSITHSIRYNQHQIDFTVQKKVLECIKKANVFGISDFTAYRSSSLRDLCDIVWNIATSKADSFHKKRLLQEIVDSKYYQDFLSQGEYNKNLIGKKEFCLRLLYRKRFWLLIHISSMIYKTKNILVKKRK